MTSKATIRKPTTRAVKVAILGAGFGGLCMAIKLKEAGINDFIVLEKGSEVGGTWRDNSYPGCACDVQSHMYSFSFEGKPDWTKRYAPWNEIQDYILETTDKYRLRPHIEFNQEVVSAVFDEESAYWTIRTVTGDTIVANHWVIASGPLHVPNIPNLPGLDSFKGKVFHSAQWDHDYDLKGKKVVSIGTGGSAIQYVPEIAPEVESIAVFQRSAAWVIPRDERKYPAFEKSLFKRLPALRKLHRARLYWTNEMRVWPMFNPAIARTVQKLAEAFLNFQVKDPETRKKLTPDYTIGCKRVLISNKYYKTFNRDNVELVTEGIRAITEKGVVSADGVEHEADCIILGTGFIVDPRIYMKDFELKGLRGHVIQEDWKDSAESYYGMTVSGYPNMYQLVGPNTGLGHNSIIFMIESQVNYVMQCLEYVDRKGPGYLDLKQDVMKEFNEKLQEQLQGTVWESGCQSWYQQADGKNITLWPKSTWRFWLETKKMKPADYNYVKCSLKAGAGVK